MNYIIIPEDTYTVSSGSYQLIYKDPPEVIKTITYNSETNTSEYFLQKHCSVYSNYNNIINTNINSNYYTINITKGRTYFSIRSSTNDISDINLWMYPLYNGHAFIQTINFPITRTISIIINSNTLPVYNIENDINLNIESENISDVIIIPKGIHSYSTINNIILDYGKVSGSNYNNYFNIPYFTYVRYISNTPQTSFNIKNNEDFLKYYGLLHMIYTEDIDFNTNTDIRRFPTNMTPVYRSLHIPEGNYTVNALIEYINNNSSFRYNVNGYSSLSYTQFLAKVVDNDIVIYTDDGSEFFINPICKMNTYQESNFASEHRLCAINESIYNFQPFYIANESFTIYPNITGEYTAINLPDGITLDVNGTISGTFKQSGIFTGQISCNNLNGIIEITFKVKNRLKINLNSNKFKFV